MNETAFEAMGNTAPWIIAAEFVTTVRQNAGTGRWKRDNVRSRMRVAAKRILKRYGYPPNLGAEAVQTVIRQAEAIARSL